METIAETTAPAPTHAATSTIETDTYCPACGFNLHTQPVWRDERLNILVARCPECGQHHPAGNRTTAPNAWLGRIAFFGLVAWVLLVLGFLVSLFFGLIGIHALAQEEGIRTFEETRSGQSVYFDNRTRSWIATSSRPTTVDGVVLPVPVPQSEVVLRQRIHPWIVRAFTGNGRLDDIVGLAATILFLAFGLLLCSILLATATWFWPKPRRYLWLLLPLFATALIFLITGSRPQYSRSTGLPLPTAGPNLIVLSTLIIGFVQITLMFIGLHFGLPIARLLIRFILPPKPRQYFAFLWLTDNLTPPLKP